MHLYSFLSALPALLGLAGFVLYQVLGANKAGDDITRSIVGKLRDAGTYDVPPDQRLTPTQLGRLLEHQQRLREIVGKHDFVLLKQALSQQFILTIFVYVLTLGFCGWSVYLFVQPPRTAPTTNPQSSTGNNSPNVISIGSGPVTVTIQDQPTPKAVSPAKRDEKKK